MKTVTFSFRSEVTVERQAEILEQLESKAGIAAARKVKPDSRNATVSRMAYVRVSDDADVDGVIRELAESSEIDTPPTVPAKRRLARR